MKEAKYLEEQKRQVEQKTERVARTTRRDACTAKNERRRGTKPKSNAQFIRKVDQDERTDKSEIRGTATSTKHRHRRVRHG